MPAAIRSPLNSAECTSTTFVSRPENCSERSGEVTLAAVRGSSDESDVG
jgi:hypothetical protein